MTITIKLLKSEPRTKEGYPLALVCSHGTQRPKKTFAHSEIEFFNDEMQMVTDAHPDYDILAPKIMDFKLKARKIIMSGEDDPKKALAILLNKKAGAKLFLDFANEYVAELNAQAKKYDEINDLVNRNKALGNAKVYADVISKIKLHFPGVSVEDLTFDKLLKFKNDCLTKGNSKNTVHLYLRSMRSLYNKCIKVNVLDDKKPFAGIFAGLKVRSSNNKKKYISIDAVRQMECIEYDYPTKEKYSDLFLLSFYFAGCDLIDIYFLKNTQIRNGRVRFMRGKNDTDLVIDLKIHPKAQAIINKYKVAGEYVFPWRKDNLGYKTFRGNLYENLKLLQSRHGIELLPDGGNLAMKVARHTFGNIAKNLFIDTDLLRELMGHERDDVDQFYKDKFPEAVRDEALFRIIG